MCPHYTPNADYAGAAERYRNAYGTGGFDSSKPAPAHCDLCGRVGVDLRTFGDFSYRACADVVSCEEERAREMVQSQIQLEEGWPL